MCRILCKCYTSLIVTHNGCQSFLHIFHIRQKLPKPNCFFNTMAKSHPAFIVDNAMVGCFLHFHKMTPTPTKKHIPCGKSPVVCISRLIHITKIFQNNIIIFEHNLKSKVPFKYLMMRFTANQYGKSAFDMNWLIILTTNAILAFATTIEYMRNPTPALYIHKLFIQKF